MKIRNIIIICFLVILLIILITCTGNIKISFEDVVVFDYPVPDGMITDETEKELMIKAKIKQLEEINSVYWRELPAEKDKMKETVSKICKYIRTTFPGFKGLDLDWDNIEKETFEKAKNIKNYGDFVSLITKIAFKLKEGHSSISTDRLDGNLTNNSLEITTPFKRHSPIFFAMNDISRIGACLTITNKEELIINKIIDKNNPYNLKMGDEIVGFNGITWSEWYPYLLEANIPIYGSAGASEGARKYILLKSAMANANLFEKINIKRYDTGKIETFNIEFFDFSPNENEFCTDYIGDIKGIKTPITKDYYFSLFRELEEKIIYGIIEGKNIGYIYLTSFYHFDEKDKDKDIYEISFSKCFEKAVLDLINTDGLIIDVRKNSGGKEETVYKGLSHLIKSNRDMLIFKTFIRDNNNILNSLKIDEKQNAPLKADNPDLYYEKLIIILTGPDCISACDAFIALASKFPEFKIIGNHNNGSFAGITLDNYRLFKIGKDSVQVNIPEYVVMYADDENPYLLRRSDFVDEFVLPTKEDIANGIDTVREHAIKLIQEANKN